ncbi:MAG: hydroxymethylglutaryl-CoA lyase [Phycisphaerae bacterium]|nr:hydroxymethylglutaryl-CoA lyase [Phycisphaerae bacterium]|tara:strand:+ start:1193 stop:2092 length:900 start_codon:yes stop_codon:yes gene_type:complete
MTLPARIHLTEVGPRDGLQNEPENISASTKIDFINRLSESGLSEIEATACVSPKWVPQLADAVEVLKGIRRREGVVYSALVPNLEGWQRASDAGVDKISVFTAASETFSQKNTNGSIDETINRFVPVVSSAHDAGCPVRAYVSCITVCPYEGRTQPSQVASVVRSLLDIGIDEIDLGDTVGAATPADMDSILSEVGQLLPVQSLVMHLHDTRGMAAASCLRAMQLGVHRFDASCGGLGGCPYAPGASGNMATGDLLYLCEGLGIETGVDRSIIVDAGRIIESAIGRPLSGRLYRTESSL